MNRTDFTYTIVLYILCKLVSMTMPILDCHYISSFQTLVNLSEEKCICSKTF